MLHQFEEWKKKVCFRYIPFAQKFMPCAACSQLSMMKISTTFNRVDPDVARWCEQAESKSFGDMTRREFAEHMTDLYGSWTMSSTPLALPQWWQRFEPFCVMVSLPSGQTRIIEVSRVTLVEELKVTLAEREGLDVDDAQYMVLWQDDRVLLNKQVLQVDEHKRLKATNIVRFNTFGGGKRGRVAGSKGGNKEEKLEEIAEHLGLAVVRVANSYLHTAPTDEMMNSIMLKMREIQAGVRLSDQVLAGMSEADMTSISASLLSTNGEKKVMDFAKIAFASEFRAINEFRKVLSTLESGLVGVAEMMLVNDFPNRDASGVISWESLSKAVLEATARRGVAVGRAQAAATPAVGAPLD
jgi:hypothetical protein